MRLAFLLLLYRVGTLVIHATIDRLKYLPLFL